jgi:hypothetical protein
MAFLKQLKVEDYRVACITGIPEVFAVLNQMFNVQHQTPAPRPGTHRAAITAANVGRTFPTITLSPLVGIGVGVPSLSHNRNVCLGDVVVAALGSYPTALLITITESSYRMI